MRRAEDALTFAGNRITCIPYREAVCARREECSRRDKKNARAMHSYII